MKTVPTTTRSKRELLKQNREVFNRLANDNPTVARAVEAAYNLGVVHEFAWLFAAVMLAGEVEALQVNWIAEDRAKLLVEHALKPLSEIRDDEMRRLGII